MQAQRAGGGYAVHAGDAVVHGDQHVSAAVFHALRDGCREAVAIDHAVGHDVAHIFCTQQAQAAQADGAGGGAVAVVVGHDAEFFVLRNRIGQHYGGLCGALHRGRGQQQGQAVVQLGFALHAARRIQARQQRVNAGLLQRPGGARWNVAYY